jgi:hypothetical protein
MTIAGSNNNPQRVGSIHWFECELRRLRIEAERRGNR